MQVYASNFLFVSSDCVIEIRKKMTTGWKYLIFSWLVLTTLQIRAAPHDNLADDGWVDFKYKYKKHYSNDTEEKLRRDAYHANLQLIADHNEKYEAGIVSYKLRINHFGDKLLAEYKNFTVSTAKMPQKLERLRPVKFTKSNRSSELASLPDFVDWREQGAVTPVQDQGRCGSCWAFSAKGALEAQYFKKTGILRQLSAQTLVDCTKRYGNRGCHGGGMDLAFQFVADHKGLESEEEYPYNGRENECPYDIVDDDVSAKAKFSFISHGDETALKLAVATIGPISVGFDALHDTFRFYSEGIYHEPNCNSTNIVHAGLIVGYGTDSKNQDYWIVKNSWSEDWGDKGYFKIARNQQSHCGIATNAIYPL